MVKHNPPIELPPQEDQLFFDEPQLTQRMEGALFDMIGRQCTFEYGGPKRRRGKIIAGSYDGIRADMSHFTLTVQGESGRIVTIDFRKNSVQLY